MCGFVGVFGPSSLEVERYLKTANDAMLHRGPDYGEIYRSRDGLCLLGHRRLSIVDLSDSANQPFRRDNKVLVYNGEIYNHQDLRRRFLSGNTVFRSHSDTETLFCLLGQDSSEKVLTQLVGMYAGAFFDEDSATLTLFRDSLGIKPLYLLTLADSTLVFASEIRAILALIPEYSRYCEGNTLFNYLKYENWPQGDSLFQGIRLLKPGSCITATVTEQGQVKAAYKTLNTNAQPKRAMAYPDLVSHCRNLIEKSVNSHLMSDVPLGVYLSGGIDSSLVATLAARQQKDILGFTGYFHTKDGWYDERSYSRIVAESAGIPLQEVCITPEDFKNCFDNLIYSLEEPRMGMGTFSQYIVAKEASKHRKVILAGHGGDELFGGYPLFKAFQFLEHFPTRKAWSMLPQFSGKEWPWLIDMFLGILKTRKIHFAPQLFSPLPKNIMGVKSLQDEIFVQERSQNPLLQLNQYYLTTYLPGLLAVEDKISMAHSLETRIPLWSQALYEGIINIPIEQKLRQGQLKGLLKGVAQGILPDALLSAPKRGFPTPLRLWFRNELYDEVRTRLLDGCSQIYSLMPRQSVEKLLKNHLQSPLPFALDERRAHRIWMLLCLESWARQFKMSLGGY